MDWTRLEVDGRVTALADGLCAGVGADGDAFVVPLRLPHPAVRRYDGLQLDSFGVLGVAQGEDTWLTGRGADGRLHLWSAHADGSRFVPHTLRAVETAWAAPLADGYDDLVLAARPVGGAWRLAVHRRDEALEDGDARAPELELHGDPQSSLAFGLSEHGPLVVVGCLGEAGVPQALSLGRTDTTWRRIHLAPTPTALTSVATGHLGRHTWVAGHVSGRPAVHEVLPLPFRGLLRSAAVDVPPLELAPDSLEDGRRPLVLVDRVERDTPAFVAALTRGNRLCWHDGSEWKAHPVPDGRVRAACASGGAVHVLVDGSVWSLPDPT